MSTHAHQPPPSARSHAESHAIPRAPIVAAGALVLVSLLAVAGARHGRCGHQRQRARRRSPSPPPSRRVSKTATTVPWWCSEAGSGRVLMPWPSPAPAAFCAARCAPWCANAASMAWAPNSRSACMAHPDGRLTLEDPATGRRMDLSAFGPSNAAVFARVLSNSTAAR
jgi:hypothetical protein